MHPQSFGYIWFWLYLVLFHLFAIPVSLVPSLCCHISVFIPFAPLTVVLLLSLSFRSALRSHSSSSSHSLPRLRTNLVYIHLRTLLSWLALRSILLSFSSISILYIEQCNGINNECRTRCETKFIYLYSKYVEAQLSISCLLFRRAD